MLPPRPEGAEVTWDQRVTLGVRAAGVIAWVFPNVAFLDEHGLNDWVVARHPIGDDVARRESNRRSLNAIFGFVDADQNAVLDGREIAAAVESAFPGLSADPVAATTRTKNYVAAYDRDRDGAISRSELVDTATSERRMAHDRLPPAGYVEGFRPNLLIHGDGEFEVVPRRNPLTDAMIREHEAKFRKLAAGWQHR